MLKIGIIQQHNTPDISDNRNRLMQKIRALAADGAQLIVNQELHDSLYFCQTENVDICSLATPIPSDVTDAYAALAKELGVAIVTSLFERRAPGLYHNTAVVFEKDGTIAGKYRKMPMTRLTTKSSISPPVTLDSSLSTHPSVVWAFLSAGISGIPKLRALWHCVVPRFSSTLQPSASNHPTLPTNRRVNAKPGSPCSAAMPWPTDCQWWP